LAAAVTNKLLAPALLYMYFHSHAGAGSRARRCLPGT
jgi:hypothetical protein